jgi:hypothetical protein
MGIDAILFQRERRRERRRSRDRDRGRSYERRGRGCEPRRDCGLRRVRRRDSGNLSPG